MTAVRCVDICKTYRQGDLEVTGLDHVDLEIEEGGFVCLSAPSGGGKTTLLNAIGGLDTPDSGEIRLAILGEMARRMVVPAGSAVHHAVYLQSNTEPNTVAASAAIAEARAKMLAAS